MARCGSNGSGFAQELLLRPQRNLYRTEWPGGGLEYHPSQGEWVRILHGNGFEVEALHELYAPADAHLYYEITTEEWAQRWPAEDLREARLPDEATNEPEHSGLTTTPSSGNRRSLRLARG